MLYVIYIIKDSPSCSLNQTGKKIHPLSESLTPLGRKGGQLSLPPKSLGTRVP